MGFPIIKSDGNVLVVIYSTNGGGKRAVHGAYYAGEDNGWVPCSWYPDGIYLSAAKPSKLDIKEAVNAGKLKIQSKTSEVVQETEGQV